MIWRADANGCFKVSIVFSSKEKGASLLWSKAWIKGIIPKINIVSTLGNVCTFSIVNTILKYMQ